MPKIKLYEVITKLELGGAQLSTLELIQSLDKEVYDISLLTAPGGELLPEAAALKGVKVVAIPSLRRKINLFLDCKTLFLMYRLFKKEKPHIVHTHSSKAGILGRWAARLAGVKSILHTVHGWEFHQYQNKLKRWFYISIEKITAPFTDYFIAVTHHDIEKGLSCGIGSEHQYQLIRYGIDKKKFSVHGNGSLRKQYGIGDTCFVVGMVACFKPQKAPLDFVFSAARAAQKIPDVKFVMVGDGCMRARITRLIHRLGVADKFMLLGWRRDIPSLLSSFDVVSLSSLWEGLPIVFLEAMASGKPIVATDICGNAELVKDNRNGFLVAPNNHESFSECIIRLYRDKALARQMGHAGRVSLNGEFDVAHMVSNTDALYRASVREKGGA